MGVKPLHGAECVFCYFCFFCFGRLMNNSICQFVFLVQHSVCGEGHGACSGLVDAQWVGVLLVGWWTCGRLRRDGVLVLVAPVPRLAHRAMVVERLVGGCWECGGRGVERIVDACRVSGASGRCMRGSRGVERSVDACWVSATGDGPDGRFIWRHEPGRAGRCWRCWL